MKLLPDVCAKSPDPRLPALLWLDAIGVGSRCPPPSTLQLALHRFVWPIVAEPFLVIVPSFVSPLQSPSCSCTANISSSSLRKVTSNDPDVTLELKPALTGSAAPRGEAMFVSVLLLTLN